MRRLTAALSLLALALAGCEDPAAVGFCGGMPAFSSAPVPSAGGPRRLSIAPPVAVQVTVVDSITGRDLSASATGSYVMGAVADSLHHEDRHFTLIAIGPSGRYSLAVEHAGYAAWSRDVQVTHGECEPGTEVLTARLRPLGAP